MSKLDKNETYSAIQEAIRAKRESRGATQEEIARQEQSLIADLESFDIDSAERMASQEHVSHTARGQFNGGLAFPVIADTLGTPAAQASSKRQSHRPAALSPSGNGLLAQLRQQASIRQHDMQSAQSARAAQNELIDQALNQVFFFLHELVQQLNIVRPDIPRQFPLIDTVELGGLSWKEGFADYRSQAQSAGALVEQVSLTYQISSPRLMTVQRDGPAVERFSTRLFDYGLKFSCREYRNDRRYLERAEFEIQSQLSVSARWKADFAQGKILLETRNLERLGSFSYTIQPAMINPLLLDEFGRLLLAQPNRFRDLIRP